MAVMPTPDDPAGVQRLVDSVRAGPQEVQAPGMTVSRFRAPGVNLRGLGEALVRWYREQSLESDVSDIAGAVVIRCRSRSGRSLVGGSRGLTVVLRQDGLDLAVEIGAAKWSNKAWVAGAGVGVLMMGSGIGLIPLAASAVGAWRQWRLPAQTLDFLRAATPPFTGGRAAGGEQYAVLPTQSAPRAVPSVQVPPQTSPVPPRSPAPLEVNAASAHQLAQVPGLDAAIARDLIIERERLRGFRSWDQVRDLLARRLPAHRLALARPWLAVAPPPESSMRGTAKQRTSHGAPSRGPLEL